MARILGALPAALVAARGGMSANQFYRQLQAEGYGARRGEVLQLYKTALNIVHRTPDEPFKELGTVPSGSEVGIWPTRDKTGLAQTVALTYRDRTTGNIKQTWYRTVTPHGMTREQAIAQAIGAYSEHAESYEQDLIGAVHTSAYNLSPFVSVEL